MKMFVLVPLDIEFGDEDVGDPVAGDPLEDRMKASAVEAVTNKLRAGESNGFTHDMGTITCISVDFENIRVIDSDNLNRKDGHGG